MADYEFSTDEFVALAQRLDALGGEISAKERALLFAVFQMAGDNLTKRGKTPQSSTKLEGAADLPGRSAASWDGGQEARLVALEERVRRLESLSTGPRGGVEALESVNERRVTNPTVQLRTEGGGVPKLSDGFLGSFQRGRPGSIVSDDVGVSVNVGVMF